MPVITNPCSSFVLLEYPRNFSAQNKLGLGEDAVHLWFARVNRDQSDVRRLAELLSADELERMARFRLASDRANFIFARSMLRILLASYLGTPPAELRFAYSAHGKPSLATAPPTGSLQFSLSHSAGAVLLGLCRGRQIGVDVERIRHDLKVHDIAQQFFSIAEKQALARLPEMSVYDAFFSCWTRKESFVKARGEGLSCPLDSFDVSVRPEDEEIVLTTRPDSSEAKHWRLRSLNMIPGHAASVAIEGSCGQ